MHCGDGDKASRQLDMMVTAVIFRLRFKRLQFSNRKFVNIYIVINDNLEKWEVQNCANFQLAYNWTFCI
jgi:hypothetical protein